MTSSLYNVPKTGLVHGFFSVTYKYSASNTSHKNYCLLPKTRLFRSFFRRIETFIGNK